MEYGCGQCMPCRINKGREWVGRLLLERNEHRDSCFVTLTIDDEHLRGRDLNKRSLQLFLKRLRERVGPIRYFAVGEYGDESWRPHYHLIIFGLSPTQDEEVKKSWPYGFVQVGTADVGAIKYITGYVLKKMTVEVKALGGRVPEFALMSRHPGIGHGVVSRIHASVTAAPSTVNTLAIRTVRVSGKLFPLGRYLREKTLERCGISKDERAIENTRTSIEVAERKSVYPSIDAYEVQRKARVEQQNYRKKGRSL
ncbi:replication associated protein [Microviridae sp.]|nr:replication associated protein [Microviridae sp.]